MTDTCSHTTMFTGVANKKIRQLILTSRLSQKCWCGKNTGEPSFTQKMDKISSGDPDKDFKDLDDLASLMRNDSTEDPPLTVTLMVIGMFKARTDTQHH
jgi:hypothetical protein